MQCFVIMKELSWSISFFLSYCLLYYCKTSVKIIIVMWPYKNSSIFPRPFRRIEISPKGYFVEWAFRRKDISPNPFPRIVHFVEEHFAKNVLINIIPLKSLTIWYKENKKCFVSTMNSFGEMASMYHIHGVFTEITDKIFYGWNLQNSVF